MGMTSSSPSQPPSFDPSLMPSSSPSLMSSDKPSLMSSDIPSLMPTDKSSFMPSDKPSESFMPSVCSEPSMSSFANLADLEIAADMWIYNESQAEEIYGPIEDWDVECVTDMNRLFCGYDNVANDPTKTCRESRVEMHYFNADISKWNVARVTNMDWMFRHTHDFNADLSDWNVGQLRKMNLMFREADA